MAIDVLIERGEKKVFASALEWPGWARAARTPEEGVAALEAYVSRYRPVTERAGVRLPTVITFDVVETVRGSATTARGPSPEGTRKVWPYRYAVRRFAWHVLDHAWEMEDRRP